MSTQKIAPFLWSNINLEEAMAFYKSIFKNASFTILSRWQKGGMGPEGSVMSATFNLEVSISWH